MIKIRECSIGNLSGLANRHVGFSIPLFRRPTPEDITITVVHRMAHLIARIETTPTTRIAIGAKWVLANLNLLPEGCDRAVLRPFQERLKADLSRFEEHNGPVDAGRFANIISLAGYSPPRVLFGLTIEFVSQPCYGTPELELSRYISYSMWRQGLWD